MAIRCRLMCNRLPKAESMTGGAPKHETPGLHTGHHAVRGASESTHHRAARLGSTPRHRRDIQPWLLPASRFPERGWRPGLRCDHSIQHERARYSLITPVHMGIRNATPVRKYNSNVNPSLAPARDMPDVRGLLKTGMHGTFVFAHSLEPSTVPPPPLHQPLFFFKYSEEIWKVPEIGSHSQHSILSIVSPCRGVSV